MNKNHVGTLVRGWRHQRSRSQLDVAYGVGVSPKHLSFVETGRSRTSPELIDAIGVQLDIPLRERNTMLLAAGFAPRYQHTPLDDSAMAGVVEWSCRAGVRRKTQPTARFDDLGFRLARTVEE